MKKHAAETSKFRGSSGTFRGGSCALPGGIRERTEERLEEPMWLNSSEGAAKGTSRVPLVPVPDLSQFDPEYSTADLERGEIGGFGEHGLRVVGGRRRKEHTAC